MDCWLSLLEARDCSEHPLYSTKALVVLALMSLLVFTASHKQHLFNFYYSFITDCNHLLNCNLQYLEGTIQRCNDLLVKRSRSWNDSS